MINFKQFLHFSTSVLAEYVSIVSPYVLFHCLSVNVDRLSLCYTQEQYWQNSMRNFSRKPRNRRWVDNIKIDLKIHVWGLLTNFWWFSKRFVTVVDLLYQYCVEQCPFVAVWQFGSRRYCHVHTSSSKLQWINWRNLCYYLLLYSPVSF